VPQPLPTCRFCGAPVTLTFADLGSMPLANSFITREDLTAGHERSHPLHARVCDQCLLVQVDDPVAAEDIFGADYAYLSSYSDSWVAHCRRYAEMMIERLKLDRSSLVIEVASNDGYMLRHFVERGVPVLGIEPAANCAQAARKVGVPTEVMFFSERTASEIAARGLRADLMIANNVLAHVPRIRDFVAGFPLLLKPNGTLTFEFPHLLNLIQLTQFDTIYHEHFSYLSLLVVERVLHSVGMRAYDVEELPTHGGSLRVFCCHQDASHAEGEGLGRVRRKEIAAGLDRIEGYTGFPQRIEAVTKAFLAFLAEAKAAGKRVAAYGAAAKGNTFLNVCKVGTDDIVCVFDRSREKQGRLLPGSHIPVLAPEAIREVRPDYVVILPWNIADELTQAFACIRDWGGKFVIAIPQMKIW
jgi:SAM-dependent methyltransferase